VESGGLRSEEVGKLGSWEVKKGLSRLWMSWLSCFGMRELLGL
jgi:hypothetical protein